MAEMIGKFNGDNGEVRNFAQIPWRDYLQSKNYDKDINNMCGSCIADQKKRYGEITIQCSGMLTAEHMVTDEVRHMFTEEEFDLLRQTFNPYYWADKNIDLEKVGKDERLFSRRWYQEFYTSCSAKRKTIRSGRRIGKTFGIVLALLHRMMTNENYNILVVTPFDAQAEEVFTTMKKILNALPETFDSIVKRSKESPNYLIQFHNGSRLKAFTVGSSGGGQIRGQPADVIYIDEADLLDQKDFNSILAILLDKPNTELWVSSTPDGERQMYKLSEDSAFKEFHFPSSVLPHYNDNIDKDLRSQSDEMGYVQEVLAEFGASRMGVFQKYYIDQCVKLAFKKTEEDLLRYRNNFIVTMGCDWNHDQIGTRICVLAFDKTEKVFFIAEKVQISKEGWTQTTAMEKIIELNRKYRFDKIYIDEGYGATQAEILKGFAIGQYGKIPPNHPDLLLAELKSINFSSKIEVRDPYSDQDVKKDIKPYMVETLNRLIEKSVLKLDPIEDKKLIDQLKGYQEKRSIHGRPTYFAASSTVGDHDLDALMLASLAYNFEYSELFANLRTPLAIKILSAEDVHGKNIDHLNPSNTYSKNEEKDGLEIKFKKRENCAPNSRVSQIAGSLANRDNDWPHKSSEVRMDFVNTSRRGTLFKNKGKRAQF